MEVSIWDTYVKRKDGLTMHFDIVVNSELIDKSQVFIFGEKYLKSKLLESKKLTSKECNFCHLEKVSELIEKEIENKGYYIIEMENCN